MEEISTTLKDIIYIYTLTMVRLSAAFLFFPLLNKQLLGGAMIRNGIIGAMAIFLYPLTSSYMPETSPDILIMMSIILKEIFIGMLMGFIFNIPFWSLEAAGFFMDNQRGASMASTLNPLSGSESSPLGILFSQAFTIIFIISGMFLLILKTVFFSYEIWPLFSFYPNIKFEGVTFFLGQFDRIITLAVWLASPIVICMFITEFGIALISRSAPQLNVFILAMPIKSAVAVAVLSLYIGVIMLLGKKSVVAIPGFIKQLGLIFL